MSWQQPLALLGVLTVALPVLIHLLGRGHARVKRFPTLRFLDASRLLPTKRTRVQDLVLLVVRCAILVIASIALTQPVWVTDARRTSMDRGLARAIIVDTSASARASIDSARTIARQAASEAQISVTVESAHPRRALAGAVEWLNRQGRRGEVVLVSDMQRGVLDLDDVRAIAPGIGFSTRRIRMTTPDSVRTTSDDGGLLTIAAAPNEAVLVEASRIAANTRPVRLPLDTARRIAVVFPRYPNSESLKRGAAAIGSPWMVELLWKLRVDSIPVDAGIVDLNGMRQLALFAHSPPGTVESARLVAAARGALSIAPPVAELEPSTMTAAEIAALQRTPASKAPFANPDSSNGPSDSRWLWLAVAGLMIAERWIRRSRAVASAPTEEQARAA
jgi:hypothetical protein